MYVNAMVQRGLHPSMREEITGKSMADREPAVEATRTGANHHTQPAVRMARKVSPVRDMVSS